MISVPQLTPAAEALETELVRQCARSEAFLRRLEKERREQIMRAAALPAESDYAI